jgi:hydrogenase nickel incorporation protein HypA/HybF
MHEWALAESVITSTIETAKKKKLKSITDITIHIGELQQIDHDIFLFALKELIKQYDKKIKKVKFHLKTDTSKLQCLRCNHSWGFSDFKKNVNEQEVEFIHFIPEVALAYTRCPQCGSPDFTIVKGRGVSISSIKGLG